MPTQSLFEGAISTLQKTLNRGSLRHRVLTSNIANIDTPNYKAFEVVMEDVRQKKDGFSGTLELVRTGPRHLDGRRCASSDVKIKASDPPPFNLRADGNTVDLETATYNNSIGDPELGAVWSDPDFDPNQLAFYYVRVLQIPTPRWTAYDAAFFGVKYAPDDQPMVIQERAYTSPIWYTP